MQRVHVRSERRGAKSGRLAAGLAEHRAAEAALRRQKQFADGIIDSLPGIFCVVAENGRLLRWNRKFLEVTGYSDEQVRHMRPADFFADDCRERVAEALEQAFDTGEMAVEAEVLARSGTRIPHYLTGRRTVVGGRGYVVGLGIDITERTRLEKELEFQAHTDPLTGVSTRRHFLELAESELARTRRYGGNLSVLMLDIDRFKAINDRHGHVVGDRVLQALGDTCRRIFRAIDVVGRIGGEEFAILLPATDVRKACEVAERLRRHIEQASVPLSGGKGLHFTASIGVTGLDAWNSGLDVLLDRADKALYQAKHGGRNQVVAG